MSGDLSLHFKKKVTPGTIDVHPTENAILVNYVVQTNVVGENRQQTLGDRKTAQKTIRIKTLHAKSNLSTLAQEIMDRCKLIHPSKQRDLEQLLFYLQQRQTGQGLSDREWLKRQIEGQKKEEESDDEPEGGQPSLANVDGYIEGLYEEVPDKVKSTRAVMELAKDPENMDVLVANDALMSALPRVLREDGRRSMDLTHNILYFFFCLSNFSQYHPLITAHKIGDMCLKTTDQELARYDLWMKDLAALESKSAQTPADAQLASELEREHRKLQAMLRKQDQLLFVSFHLLLNLAEDLNVEVKMVKRGVIRYLVGLLDRKTPELVILMLTFLKKLSIFKENKDEMVKNSGELLEKLDPLIPSAQLGIQTLALRLLLNLSHDAGFRATLVSKGTLGKFVALLHDKDFTLIGMQLLYQMSIDDNAKSMFSFTDTIPQILKLILESKPDRVNVELMALAINVSLNRRNAEVICEDSGLKFLMKRAFKTRDSLLFKMLRNLCTHNGAIKMMFLDYIDDMMHLLFKCAGKPELLVEILGILSNLTIPDFDFAKLAEAYDLLGFISSHLNSALALLSEDGGKGIGLTEDDDVTLEVINLLGTMAADESLGPMILKTTILQKLLDMMIAKEEDDEIILQIIFCTYQFLLLGDVRDVLINKTQVVSYLIDLLYDRNVEIRRMCDVCLDIISETSEEWALQIKQQKFQWHNSEWLQCMAQATEDDQEEDLQYASGFPDDPDLDPSYLNYSSAARRGAIISVADFSDSEEDFRGSMIIGGNSALLEGF
ncbi:hypothetical protein HDU85_007412 [Gaertneriomyces sp. JEL0708]|nr:hypothetical protein HDU85_007412 [Gaertneriomyces sp. JEL0708]